MNVVSSDKNPILNLMMMLLLLLLMKMMMIRRRRRRRRRRNSVMFQLTSITSLNSDNFISLSESVKVKSFLMFSNAISCASSKCC